MTETAAPAIKGWMRFEVGFISIEYSGLARLMEALFFHNARLNRKNDAEVVSDVTEFNASPDQKPWLRAPRFQLHDSDGWKCWRITLRRSLPLHSSGETISISKNTD
jgi:hypothetical protein